VYWSALDVELVPAGEVTVTWTAPAECAGACTVTSEDDTNVTEVPAEVPNFAVTPGTNPVPWTVTVLPPAVEPWFGLTDVTVGAP
jgi:hypothetical protein